MSNEQKIIDRILADAQAEANGIIAIAEESAEAVIKEASEKAEKDYNAAYKLALAEAEKARAKEISGAEMQAKKIILTEKQAALENVISTVSKRLSSLGDEAYKDVLAQMIDSAGIDDKSEIILSKKDKDKFGQFISGKGVTVSEETRDINGGFIVKQGDVEYNYTFESIIAVEREGIEQIAAEILFK